MKIDREALLKAIKFLKPAISKAELEDCFNFLHVQVDGDHMQLTAGNGKIGKRVRLARSPQLDIEQVESEEPTHYQFLIDLATLEAFEKLCQKHKAKFDKKVGDQSIKLAEVCEDYLLSHNRQIPLTSNGMVYSDIDHYFRLDRDLESTPAWDINIDSNYLIDTLKEFGGVVEFQINGLNKHILITDDYDYQAFIFPVKVRGDGD